MREVIHTPVLGEETLEMLAPRRGGEFMIDATVGEGGHSFLFLSRFPDLRILGIDADREILETARERLGVFGERARLYAGWSHDFFAAYPQEAERPDTILMDLGISLYHYERGGRGFSFRKDEALDMRLDRERGPGAADLIARLSEGELADLLYYSAGERYSRRIARAVVEARSRSVIASSGALAEIVERAVPAVYRHGPVHPATRTFQALRIAVNGELSRLPELLEAALGLLKTGGRMGVISFHSAEDRIVKNFFREKSRDCTCPPDTPICKNGGPRLVRLLSRKGIVPGDDELRSNPPSRSARLRGVEKISGEDGS